MGLRLVKEASGDVLSLAEAKKHLRVDHSEEDGIIAAAIRAAVRHIERRELHRSLLDQTWELTVCEWGKPIRLPMPPLIEVESISYYDADNQQQTLSTDVYEVSGIGSTGRGQVCLKSGQSWPALYSRAEPVTIRFRAGYVDNEASPSGDVPEPIISAVKLYVGTLYAHRETIIVGTSAVELPGAARWLLDDYIVYE